MNEETAGNALRSMAEQGDKDAQFHLARMLYAGNGIQQDKREAIFWIREAANQGNIEAQYQFAHWIFDGEHAREAALWFRKAAEQGHLNAQYWLATMLSKGNGVPKNMLKAAAWYRAAAKQGHKDAQAEFRKQCVAILIILCIALLAIIAISYGAYVSVPYAVGVAVMLAPYQDHFMVAGAIIIGVVCFLPACSYWTKRKLLKEIERDAIIDQKKLDAEKAEALTQGFSAYEVHRHLVDVGNDLKYFRWWYQDPNLARYNYRLFSDNPSLFGPSRAKIKHKLLGDVCVGLVATGPTDHENIYQVQVIPIGTLCADEYWARGIGNEFTVEDLIILSVRLNIRSGWLQHENAHDQASPALREYKMMIRVIDREVRALQGHTLQSSRTRDNPAEDL
ncbi:MAG: sel1 repeat family protein [Alphaproteobacteria bacterium]|nr:sel1 repeat family protein [Alphaproteobacteria bacterium]